jgi:dolichyl-phosphate-mannose-protein mannosyltransferase
MNVSSPPYETRRLHPGLVFLLIFLFVLTSHLWLLQLPYFWDEAGYYIPAARDLLIWGSLIPHSTVSNAHPPLVMGYLALWWKIAGYTLPVTRSAMLLLASFTLFTLFRLAERVARVQVAIASTICTAIYPVFFAQSSLAHVDLISAGLIFGGLRAHIEDRPAATSCWFALAALAKETAILAPLSLLAWELVCPLLRRKSSEGSLCGNTETVSTRRVACLLFPVLPLCLWFGYHYLKTGYVFGNPEFFRYNVQATLDPVRVLLALGLRLWQAFGYMQLGLLTLAMLLALWSSPLRDANRERQRIPVSVQLLFLVVIATYVVVMSFVGGAVLARYLLPAVPLVIIIDVSTLWRRVRYWTAVVVIVAFAFVAAMFVNPPYGFSVEDNLAYRDYILLHENAEKFLEARYPMARVLTAWPASDELTRPYLGYVAHPMRVFRVEDFTLEQVMSAAEVRSNFDVALVFSTKYEPPHSVLEGWAAWERLKAHFFGFHRDLPPAATAQLLGGRIVFDETRHGQWVAVIVMEKLEEARGRW